MADSTARAQQQSDADARDLVPDSLIPHGHLPPLEYRDLPDSIPLRRMVGPSLILAGLALGSGEFVLWPYLTYKTGFVFFWACLLGIATQYFINMEITRWTLATGESAITGFCRLSRLWAPVFLLLNVVPWMVPAWAKGAAQLTVWLAWPGEGGQVDGWHIRGLAIGGLVFCGAILTAGPVVYNTIERVQMFLVTAIMLLVTVLAVWLVRPGVVVEMARGAVSIGSLPPMDDAITPALLLGALAFAGAGGTLNLGQSNYIKDKGYGMGKYIGRITSPITGQTEAIAEIGYHFRPTEDNLARWRRWWRAAGTEHFVNFFLTCVICVVLLTMITYSIFHDPLTGERSADAASYGDDIVFIWGQAEYIGGWAKVAFLVMGVAILLTTEFGVLDAASRISTDLVKVNWLRENPFWTESRLYYLFLWGTIGLGAAIILIGTEQVEGSFVLFKLTSALNGAVMFLYCGLLLYLNNRCLPAGIRMSPLRQLAMGWAVLFFGFFTVWAGWSVVTAWL